MRSPTVRTGVALGSLDVGDAWVALSSGSGGDISLDVSMMKLPLLTSVHGSSYPCRLPHQPTYGAGSSRIYVCTPADTEVHRMVWAPCGPYTGVGVAPMEGLHNIDELVQAGTVRD